MRQTFAALTDGRRPGESSADCPSGSPRPRSLPAPSAPGPGPSRRGPAVGMVVAPRGPRKSTIPETPVGTVGRPPGPAVPTTVAPSPDNSSYARRRACATAMRRKPPQAPSRGRNDRRSAALQRRRRAAAGRR